MPPVPPDLDLPLAAIDLGSNSFRLEIGHLPLGRYRRLGSLRDMVRLGAGLDATGRLEADAESRALACLERFGARLRGLAAGQVRAVATQTLREMRDRDAFLQRAQAALGHPIEVISGREEARLIYAGVAHLQPSERPRLVIDIGGRSTEMILGRGPQALVAESFQVGCVSLSMRFFPQGRITADGLRAAQVAAGAEFEEGLQAFAPGRWEAALGSSGTAGAASEVLAAAGVSDGRITAAGLRWCLQRCLDAGHVDRLDFAGLKPERRAVLPGGLAILYTLLVQFGIAELWPARGALRQGVIIDLHARRAALRASTPHDLRDRSVQALQRRFAVDTRQAARVRTLALALLEAAQPGAPLTARRELAWACELHEIGLMVSHHDHHRHSAYLLAHADAPGFSEDEQRRIGQLVLGQRGRLRKVQAALATPQFAWSLLCLRLAVLVAHARGAAPAAGLRLQARGLNARLEWDGEGAEAHPRTAFLLREEAQAWARESGLRLDLPY